MKDYMMAATALAMTATMADAGGIERRGDPSMILFEKSKNYAEFSVVNVNPSVSGTPLPGVPTGPTGNILKSYRNFAGGIKTDINDRFTLGLVIDEPMGADVDYKTPGSFFAGSDADVGSISVNLLARYKVSDRFSVYGGLRYMGLDGDITVISPVTAPLGSGPGTPYTLSVDKDYQFGYLLGAAYEIPDIALRLALTYESKTEHDFKDNTGASFDVEIPRAITLHFQSGIAANTLVFGSIKWREWTEFTVQPFDFISFASGAPVNVPIAFNKDDVWTYELGVGRRVNANWSGAATIGYEKQEGSQVGNLAGTDGFIRYGLAAIYENDAIKITTGISYIDLGNANSNVTAFRNNDAIAVGTKIGFKF
ncbi:OmpP1/FadL family transporter [Roseovarius autotrophicus]|uniref:OmpP1/FadL family transporter n=1 Tax=Roseovarius autotrophicus TaxID=2824121 RepID=UPI0019E05D8A|nr:outer membrane protein transport protein [Roseovarius autotrophicus]MBE0452124.1 outer membrane protein transport protein [Roseovarius sp.]